MRAIVFRFAVCAFLVLYSCCMSANSQQTKVCFGPSTDNCPPEPSKCGDQPCEPSNTWEVNPSNPCELIPVFTASCPDNSKEPVDYKATFKVCEPGDTPTGFDDFDASRIVCWKWRYCSASCTMTTQTDGTIDTRINPEAPAGCVTFQARKIVKHVWKCNAGVSSGDASLGQEERSELTCTGERIPCVITQ